jgi:hypothetical protein
MNRRLSRCFTGQGDWPKLHLVPEPLVHVSHVPPQARHIAVVGFEVIPDVEETVRYARRELLNRVGVGPVGPSSLRRAALSDRLCDKLVRVLRASAAHPRMRTCRAYCPRACAHRGRADGCSWSSLPCHLQTSCFVKIVVCESHREGLPHYRAVLVPREGHTGGGSGGHIAAGQHVDAEQHGRTLRCALARCWKCKVPHAAGSMARESPLPNCALDHISAPGSWLIPASRRSISAIGINS